VKEWLASNKKPIEWSFVALAFLLVSILVSVTSAIVVTLFLFALILRLNIGLPLAVALVLLCISALLMAVGQGPTAASLANWAYYFLAIGVVLQLVEYVRSGEELETVSPPTDEE
jgi:hypothetical protein